MFDRRQLDAVVRATAAGLSQEPREEFGNVAVAGPKEDAQFLEQAQLDGQPVLEDVSARIRKVVVDEFKRAMAGEPGPELRRAILRAQAKPEDRGQVIDARDLEGDRLDRRVEQRSQVRAKERVHLMTQSDRADGGGTCHTPADGGHRVGQIQEAGVRAQLLHLAGNLDGDRDEA